MIEIDMLQVNLLFAEVHKISKDYEDEIKKTGEGFNVFQILGLVSNEVRAHTAFIANLLNPNGSHGQGDVFLELFLNILNRKYLEIWGLNDFYIKGGMFVEKEKPIGLINEEYTKGGNVDIIIRNKKNQAIIIENKINAGDQKKQLLRYNNYGKTFSQGYELLYLTLDGRSASDWSKGGIVDENDYKKISYSNEILLWIEECENMAQQHHLLQASIIQYLYLVKLLTGKTKYNIMENQILGKIKENELSFETARLISDQYIKMISLLIPTKARNKIFEAWEKHFISKKDLLLFTYKDYEIYVSISEEQEWHTQIKPLKKTDNEIPKFGVANDEAISFVRNAIDSIEKFKKYKNSNYTIWLYSEFRFIELPLNEYVNLLDDSGVSEWANKILSEVEEILNYFVKKIFLLPEEILKEINWNEENPKVKELIGSE